MKTNEFHPDKPIDLELLINYVEDTVNEDTRQRIDQYLNENEEERLVVDGIRTYYHQYGMDRASMLSYLQNTKDISLADFKEKTVKRSTFPQWLGWAAALLLLCVSMVAYLFLGGNHSNSSRITAYLSEPYPVTVFLSDQEAASWVEAYQNGDFQQSATLLADLLRESPDNDFQLLFFAGLSHLYQQPSHPEQAIENLLQVDEGPFAQQAQWYLSLAYLLNGQMGEAQPLLERIVATQAYQHEEAAVLLESIFQE